MIVLQIDTTTWMSKMSHTPGCSILKFSLRESTVTEEVHAAEVKEENLM